jgi:tetratricopeptide (TPR) repeat protein
MKPLNTLALLPIVLALCSGCLSVSHVESWSGPQEFEGKGGAFTVRDGIEVYSAGTPKKRCRVIGVINTSTMSSAELMAVFGDSWSISTLLKEAKRRGANGIILVNDKQNSWVTGGTDAMGNYHASTDVARNRVALLVKYLEDGRLADTSGQNMDLITSLRSKAEKGDGDAQFNLGACNYAGTYGVKQDFAEAIKWYQKAANNNPGVRTYLAAAYIGRGLSETKQGSFDDAIADFSEAIHIGNDAPAYVGRGCAQQKMGNVDAAMADYNRSIALNPGFSFAYFARGLLNYTLHDLTNSLSDFCRSINSATNYALCQDYSHCYVWIIRTRLGEKEFATKELQTFLDNRIGSQEDWPAKVAKFLLGRTPESDFLQTAAHSEKPIEKGQICEAYFYAGAKRLAEGDKPAARSYFNKSVATGCTNDTEFDSAMAELKLLDRTE